MTNGEQQVLLWLERNGIYTDVQQVLKKLHEEVYELTEAALTNRRQNVLVEAGDVGILMVQLLDMLGHKGGLLHAVMVALDKNESVEWRKKRGLE